MKVHVAYEAAFEHYLRARQIPYIAVDEARRVAFRDAKLKSFDFVVYSSAGPNWLVDVKGRRWAPRRAGQRPSWQNWVTQADLDGLRQWEEVFGKGFAALLVFAYRIDVPGGPPDELVHIFGDDRYVFAGIPLTDYECNARRRSPRWGTVNVPVREFAKYVRPIAAWL